MWTKLAELVKSIVRPGLSVQYILCRLADGMTSIKQRLKGSQNSQCKKGGDIHPDYTLISSEMHGARKKETPLEKAMKAPIDIDKLRNRGF